MSKILLESDFLTVDLSALQSKKDPETTKTDGSTTGTQKGTISSTDPKETTKNNSSSQKIDWSAELKRRQDENAKLGPGARKPSGAIENKFWEDYFASEWPKDIADVLIKITDLKKDIKALGFKPGAKNPLLKFFKQKWVQDNLIRKGFINSEKYKVLHSAVSEPRTVAESEFTAVNTYNIIYCRDFYRKPVADMIQYLECQKNILSPNASFYNDETKKLNIRVFLQTGQKSVKLEKAKLNNLKEVAKVASKEISGIGQEASTGEGTSKKTGTKSNTTQVETGKSQVGLAGPGESANRQDMSNFLKKLTTVARIQVAIQYLTLNTNAGNARTALLSNDAFKKTNMDELMKATVELSSSISTLRLSSNQAEQLVDVLLDQILPSITKGKKPTEEKHAEKDTKTDTKPEEKPADTQASASANTEQPNNEAEQQAAEKAAA